MTKSNKTKPGAAAVGCSWFFCLWRLEMVLCSPFFILYRLDIYYALIHLLPLYGRLGRFSFHFVAHPVPPQRAVNSGTPANLCAITATAVQALEPNRLSSCYSFFHLLSFSLKKLRKNSKSKLCFRAAIQGDRELSQG